MIDPSSQRPFKLSKLGWIWFGLLVGLIAAGYITTALDRSTELTPAHDAPLTVAFYVALFAGLVSAILILSQSEGTVYQRFVVSFIVTPIFAFLGIFLLISGSARLVETATDFPAGKTQTFDGLLIVKRAYQTHGKGRSWNIQTMPIWSNIDITQDDYKFMLGHRPPEDGGSDDDEITSNGFFCAKATLQRSGKALQVLNAGSYALPAGSIGICSEMMADSPQIRLIS